MSGDRMGVELPPDGRCGYGDACTAAKVTVPDEVEAFFLGEPLDDGGIVVDLSEGEAVKAWNTESASGYEVDVKDLPDSIEVVRFYNSW